MGVGQRPFQTFLCDGCGREVIAEEGSAVDGYYIEVSQVRNGEDTRNDNIFACSDVCIDRAVRDAVYREKLPEEEKLSATQELWMRGRAFRTDPRLPIYDASNETRIIGTAQEIASYQPPSPTQRPTRTALDGAR